MRGENRANSNYIGEGNYEHLYLLAPSSRWRIGPGNLRRWSWQGNCQDHRQKGALVHIYGRRVNVLEDAAHEIGRFDDDR